VPLRVPLAPPIAYEPLASAPLIEVLPLFTSRSVDQGEVERLDRLVGEADVEVLSFRSGQSLLSLASS